MKYYLLPVLFIFYSLCSLAQRPTVNIIAPTQAKTGDICTIFGANFSPSIGGNTVLFGTEKATILNATTGVLTVSVPPGFGKVAVEVICNGRSHVYHDGFSYLYNNVLPVNTNLFGAETKLESTPPLSNDLLVNYYSRVDINNDDIKDILIYNSYGYLSAQVANSNYIKSSTKVLNSIPFSSTSISKENLLLADLNADGWIDVLYGEVLKGISVQTCYTNKSRIDSISFQKQPWTIAGKIICIADFDQDGLKDIISKSVNNYLYYRNVTNNGNIQFELADITATLGNVIAITDLDNDSKPDFIIDDKANYRLSILRNTSTTGFGFSRLGNPIHVINPYASSSSFTEISCEDLNNDNLKEIVFASIGTGIGTLRLYICQNTSISGNISFLPSFFIIPPSMTMVSEIILTDINGDGKQDINLSYEQSGTSYGFTVYENIFQTGNLSVFSFANRFSYSGSNQLSITDWDKSGTPTLFSRGTSTNEIIGRKCIINTSDKKITLDTTWIIRAIPDKTISVNASLDYVPDNSNVFEVELSDMNGSFNSATILSSFASTSTKLNLRPTLPSTLPAGNNYRVRLTGSAPYKQSNISKQIIVKTDLPVLDSVSLPNPGFGGAAQLHGSNFNTTESQVYVGGIKADIVNASPNQIEIKLPAGLNTDGITLHADGIIRELRKPISLSFPGTKRIDSTTFGRLNDAIQLSGSTLDNPLRLVDINNDGKLDVLRSWDVYYNNTKDGRISSATLNLKSYGVFGTNASSIDFCDTKGNGQKDPIAIITTDNKFWIGKYGYPVTNSPIQLIVADLTNDGKPEVVTYSSNTVSIYRNITPSGSDSTIFATRRDYALTGTGWNSMHITDMDADGKAEVMLTNGTSGLISIFKNNSLPDSIILATRVDITTGLASSASVIGDLNHDGKTDLIFRSGSSTGQLSVFQNNTTQGIINTNLFLAPVNYGLPYPLSALTIADFDGDGLLDIMTAGGVSTTRLLYFIKNNNTGGFSTSNLVLSSMSTNFKTTISIQPGDLNSDGAMDVVLIFNNDPVLYLLINKLYPLSTPIKYDELTVGDSLYIPYQNNSVFGAGNQIQVQLSDTNGSFASPMLIGSKSTTLANDTIVVHIPTQLSGTRRSLRLSATNPTIFSNSLDQILFKAPQNTNYAYSILSGKTDDQLVISSTNVSNIQQVTFGSVASTILGRNTTQLVCKVPYASNSLPIRVYTNNGLRESNLNFNHIFNSRNDVNFCVSCFNQVDIMPSSVNSIALSDFDSDGRQDMVTLGGGVLGILHNQTPAGHSNTLFHFKNLSGLGNLNNPSLQVMDLNGDGKDDIIVHTSTKILIMLNLSTASIPSISAIESYDVTGSHELTGLKIKDINIDGKPDLIFGTRTGTTSSSTHQLGFAFYLNNLKLGTNTPKDAFDLFALHNVITYPYLGFSHSLGFQLKDMNNDRLDEIIFTASHLSKMYFITFKNRNNLTFDTTSIEIGGTNPSFDMDDIDGNGTADIMICHSNGTHALINNNISGPFNKSLITSTYLSSTTSIAGMECKIADLDFDGYKDFISQTSSQLRVMKRRNTPAPITSSSFQPNVILSSTSYSMKNFIMADFNSDNKPEVAFVVSGVGTRLLKNNTPLLKLNELNSPWCSDYNQTVKFTTPSTTFTTGNQFTLELSDTNGSFINAIVLDTLMRTTSGEFNFTVPDNLKPSNNYKIRMYGSQPNHYSENVLNVEIKSCPKDITFEPTKGEPGSEVTIRGQFKSLNQSDVAVYFADCKAKVTSVTDSTLKVIVPEHVREGIVRLTVAGVEIKAFTHFLPTYTNHGIFDNSCAGKIKKYALMETGTYLMPNEYLADLDEDGQLDYKNHSIKYDPLLDTIYVKKAFNLTATSFTTGKVKMADLSGDGIPDIIGVGHQANCTFPTNPSTFQFNVAAHGSYSGFYAQNGGQTYTFANITNCYSNGINFAVGDFNNDGNNDVLVEKANGTRYILLKRVEYPTTTNWLEYNHTNLSQVSNTNGNLEYMELIAEDMDGDHKPELISESDIRTIYHNQATDAVTLGPSYALPQNNKGLRPILLCDLNQDGKKDIIRFETEFTLADSPYLRISVNNSVGASFAFTAGPSILRYAIRKVLCSDYDGDGLPDIILQWSDSSMIYQYIDIIKNTSSGNTISFSANPIRQKVSATTMLAGVYDITHDKKPDLLLYSGDTLFMIKNTTPVLQGELVHSSICANDSLRINLIASDISFASGNQFTVELTDTLGSFQTSTILGVVNNQGAGMLSIKLPPGIIPSNNYKIRVSSNQPSLNVIFSNNQLMIKGAPVLNHTWPSPNQTCIGDSITFTINSPNAAYTYYWKHNGTILPDSNRYVKVIKQSGNYHLIAQNNGCETSSTSFSVTFHPKPIARILLLTSTIICGSDSITLFTDSVMNHRYRWFRNGNMQTGDTSHVIKTNQAGTYTVEITDSNNCVNRSTNTIVSQVIPPIAQISSNKGFSICQGDSFTLHAPLIAKMKYKWLLNNAGFIGDTLRIINLKNAGTVSLTLTDSTGCKGNQKDTTLIFFQLPNVSITANKAEFCSGDSVLLTSNTLNPRFKYQWLKNNVLLNKDTLPQLTVLNGGTYKLMLIDTNNCRNYSTHSNIIENLAPNNAISVSASSICAGDTAILSAVNGSYQHYQWFKNNISLPSDTLQILKVNTSGRYHLQLTNNKSCVSKSVDTLIRVNARPISGIESIPVQKLCYGDTAQLFTTPVQHHIYRWYRNDTLLINNTSLLPITKSGNYKLEITDSNGCSNLSKDTLVQFQPNPSANITLSSNGIKCLGDSIELQVNGQSGVTYKWSFNQNLIPGATSPSITAKMTGSYAVRVDNTSTGCYTLSKDTLIQFHPNPSANITFSSNSKKCLGDSIELMANGQSGVTYKWSFNQNLIAGATSPSFTAKITGAYALRVDNPVTGCYALSKDTILTFHLSPVIQMHLQSAPDLCEGDSNTLSTNMHNTYRYMWLKDNSPLTSDTLSSITVKQSGVYTIIVSNEYNCKSHPIDTALTFHPIPPRPHISKIGNTLQSSSTKGNQWYLNGTILPGETNQQITPSSIGYYQVIVTTSVANCTSDSSLAYYHNNSGIQSLNALNLLKLFPNPTQGEITINTNQELTKFELIDAIGRQTPILVERTKDGYHMNIRDNLSGHYTIRVLDADLRVLNLPVILIKD